MVISEVTTNRSVLFLEGSLLQDLHQYFGLRLVLALHGPRDNYSEDVLSLGTPLDPWYALNAVMYNLVKFLPSTLK